MNTKLFIPFLIGFVIGVGIYAVENSIKSTYVQHQLNSIPTEK